MTPALVELAIIAVVFVMGVGSTCFATWLCYGYWPWNPLGNADALRGPREDDVNRERPTLGGSA